MSASESTQHSPSKNFTLEMSDKRKKQQTREGKQICDDGKKSMGGEHTI